MDLARRNRNRRMFLFFCAAADDEGAKGKEIWYAVIWQ
jgi:hypothetical protein